MKPILLLAILLTLGEVHAQGFAVVELFTSQGCSSCPAADKALSDVIQKAEKDGTPVFGLSFHVDYWNYVGWKDPYCNKEYTVRQQTYYETLPLRSVYTPEVLVNGFEEFVGSNKKGIEGAIDFALTQKPLYQISIISLVVADGKVTVKYSLDKKPDDEVINLAVVEKDLENFVPRGENSGKTLHHDNVVRAFKTFPIKKEGQLTLKIPDLNQAKTSVIIYAQNKRMRVVTAVARPLLVSN